MPMTETVTIINNSGKIISTGKHLLGIFKDAKAAYQEKKAALKPEPTPGIQRAQTFNVLPRGVAVVGGYQQYPYDDHVYSENGAYNPHHAQHAHQGRAQQLAPAHHAQALQYEQRRYIDDGGRRRSVDDLDRRSQASSQRSRRSHRPHRSNKPGDGGDDGSSAGGAPTRPPLTSSNLRTLTEVSATTPSAAPRAYRSPYAETAPRDMMLSRPTLAHAATMPLEGSERGTQRSQAPTVVPWPIGPSHPHMPTTMPVRGGPPSEVSESTIVPSNRQSMQVARPRSDPSLRKRKSIDMNLAYGSIPPDLESRTDLEPKLKKEGGGGGSSSSSAEAEARTLMGRVEALLVEAQCVQHSATAIIARLQTNPEAAAAVALTLAELSALLTKMSPAFLGVVKGGAPAVFALLASPQFLIAAGAAVGVTIVMFGGWKIVKRMKEAQAVTAAAGAGQEQQQPFVEEPIEMTPQHPHPHPYPHSSQYPHMSGAAQGFAYGPPRCPGEASFDEALVLEEEDLNEELSTIETWRRGIAAYGEDGSVDMELISPEALRSTIEDDALSRKTGRTNRTHKSHRTHRSHRSSRRGDGEDEDRDVPERKSSRGFKDRDDERDRDRDRDRERERDRDRDRDMDRERDRDRDRERHHDRDAVTEAGSHKSHGSHRSSRSKRTERTELKAIEDGGRAGREDNNSLDSVLGRPKEKKNNMLKSIFKRKKAKEEKAETEDGETHRTEVSVLA